jgi:hypothetical protein
MGVVESIDFIDFLVLFLGAFTLLSTVSCMLELLIRLWGWAGDYDVKKRR